MTLKLDWYETPNGWAADFSSELDVQINFQLGTYGIYDIEDRAVWENTIQGLPYWEELAFQVEDELGIRLRAVGAELDWERWMEAPKPEPLPEPEFPPPPVLPPQIYSLSEPTDAVSYEAPIQLWREVPFKYYEIRYNESGYSQISTMIKTEAKDVKL